MSIDSRLTTYQGGKMKVVVYNTYSDERRTHFDVFLPIEGRSSSEMDAAAVEAARTFLLLIGRLPGDVRINLCERCHIDDTEVYRGHVWPTKLDSSSVGFEADQGILAFAVTAHPDFDDTPLYDEDRNGKADDDGNVWHGHWVVLTPDDVCGPGALKIKDIPEGTKPRLPSTWPGLPILIDSPAVAPSINDKTVEVRVPFAQAGELRDVAFDAVTAGLQVNADLHAPLVCVKNVFDVGSNDLSLPGRIK